MSIKKFSPFRFLDLIFSAVRNRLIFTSEQIIDVIFTAIRVYVQAGTPLTADTTQYTADTTQLTADQTVE